METLKTCVIGVELTQLKHTTFTPNHIGMLSVN